MESAVFTPIIAITETVARVTAAAKVAVDVVATFQFFFPLFYLLTPLLISIWKGQTLL